MVWNCVQLVFLLMAIVWLTFLILALDEDISKIKTVVMRSIVIIPDVYLIGLFFWKFFQTIG